jgi:hypothetical protein
MSRRPISKRVRFAVLERDNFQCRYCGAGAPKAVLHIDHVHPVASGGGNDPANLVTACADCNLGKAANEIRPVFDNVYEHAVSALLFWQATQLFPDEVNARVFNTISDFCIGDPDPTKYAKAFRNARSWAEARNAMYDLSGCGIE